MKRGTDHIWQLVRYKGEISIYAKCKCGFQYNCSRAESSGSFKQIPDLFYKYCPYCGARKKYYTNEIKKEEKYSFE